MGILCVAKHVYGSPIMVGVPPRVTDSSGYATLRESGWLFGLDDWRNMPYVVSLLYMFEVKEV